LPTRESTKRWEVLRQSLRKGKSDGGKIAAERGGGGDANRQLWDLGSLWGKGEVAKGGGKRKKTVFSSLKKEKGKVGKKAGTKEKKETGHDSQKKKGARPRCDIMWEGVGDPKKRRRPEFWGGVTY